LLTDGKVRNYVYAYELLDSACASLSLSGIVGRLAFLADADRILLASSCRPSVCNAVTLCIVALRVGVQG